jgi:ADP-ribosyl-[dinitrogen reductase] hydrolase
MKLSTIQRDRAIGAIIGSAAGDALGAPFEFKPPIGHQEPLQMNGGGSFRWAPGEWTDDTSMALLILQLVAAGKDLADTETQDDLVAAWAAWAREAKDVGLQTRRVLVSLAEFSAQAALRASEDLHLQSGRSGGNGSLMRTGPVGIANLDSAEQTAANALAISKLTHWDDDAAHACVLWSTAIRHAVVNGELNIRIGLEFLPADAASRWLDLIIEAEQNEPVFFSQNGWVVHAFQAAWSAVYRIFHLEVYGPGFEAERFQHGLFYAIRAGWDTDTVAAIAGSLLGAYYGFTAVPNEWRLKLHGWPALKEIDLVRLTNVALDGGSAEKNKWPEIDHFDYSGWADRFEMVQHPKDEGLWIGGVGSLENLPDDVTAVVSLCRVGRNDVPSRVSTKLEVMLLDQPGRESNLNPEFVFIDVANTIKPLRAEGHVVFLHCVQSQSRTPSVALSYSMLHFGQSLPEAQAELVKVLPKGRPIPYFVEKLEEVERWAKWSR